MSERKVLNKYYPPDFDPSKIPRTKGGKNRQFTVRLMAPCNMKCYTCGEYIAKGKKFNARKEDVEDKNYLGIRIYRFYMRCPGCISEISFRTDPETTDYIIEAGAHRNFQALKLAEDQAAREAQDIQDEIDSNPMLLLENRTQQSQYEMNLVETLEDLRELNDRHAGIDLGAVASKYQKEKVLTAEQKEEAERIEALTALGYELIEGKMVKRLREEDIDDEAEIKKIKGSNWNKSDPLTSNKPTDFKPINSLKAKLTGLVKKKTKTADSAASSFSSLPKQSNSTTSVAHNNDIVLKKLISENKVKFSNDDSETKTEMLPPWSKPTLPSPERSKQQNNTSSTSQNSTMVINLDNSPSSSSSEPKSVHDSPSSSGTTTNIATTAPVSSLSLLGAYSDSDSGSDDE